MALTDGRSRCRLATGVLALSLATSAAAWAEAPEPTKWFDDAVRSDAAGDAPLAFALYRRAAEAGLPAAEFNTAVMLDSGRGVRADMAEAATWYARAAAHGEARAAYNLGQLYESGEGVPRNLDIARAWYAASGLPAARERFAAAKVKKIEAGPSFEPPHLVSPAADTRRDASSEGVELVWTSGPQPEPVRYFVELRALDAEGSHEIFSRFVETSSVLAEVPMGGHYAWRVISTAQKAGKSVASDWVRFNVGSLVHETRVDP